MVTDFHDYERNLGVTCLAPLLAEHGIDLNGKSVLDVGCGYGGVLAALAEAFALAEARGLDLDPEMVERGRAKCPASVRLEVKDFFSLEQGGYDLILLRDVLEHIVKPAEALKKAAGLLNPGGRIYASFAPFYSPFGGHQHNGAGFFSNVPWLQILPEPWFRKLLRLKGNSYKTGAGLEADIESVLRTRLTLAGFNSMADAAGLRACYSGRFLIRPDYKIKFGLPTLGFPIIPVIGELFSTGAEALLEKI